MLNIRLFTFILILLAQVAGFGATNQPSSLAYADVLTAVKASDNGDTVLLPAGCATWTNETLTITKRLRIIGAGIDQTIIYRGTNGQELITFSNTGSNPQQLVELAHLTLDCGPNTVCGVVSVGNQTQTNRNFRLHHLKIDNVCKRGIMTVGRAEGLVDHCQINAPFNLSAQGVTVYGFTRGPATVTNPGPALVFGTFTDTVYIEDCVFNFAYDNDGAFDAYYDASFVFRHNTITNSNFLSTHNQVNGRCSIKYEFYQNYFFNTATNSTSENGFVAFGRIRSGAGVMWSNTLVSAVAVVPYLRLTDYRGSATNVWPTWYPDLVITGTNRVDGAYGDQNYTNLAAGLPIGYPGLDMPGWADPIVWTPTNTIQTFYGCYEWGNTYNASNINHTASDFGYKLEQQTNAGVFGWKGLKIPCPSELIVEGRDYFNDTPKPGYTPAPYPHPLARTTSSRSTPAPPRELKTVKPN